MSSAYYIVCTRIQILSTDPELVEPPIGPAPFRDAGGCEDGLENPPPLAQVKLCTTFQGSLRKR